MQAACAIIVRLARFSLLINIDISRPVWLATSPLRPLEPPMIYLPNEINKEVGISQIAGDRFSLKVVPGDVLIAFAVLHVFSFSVFWGPTP